MKTTIKKKTNIRNIESESLHYDNVLKIAQNLANKIIYNFTKEVFLDEEAINLLEREIVKALTGK